MSVPRAACTGTGIMLCASAKVFFGTAKALFRSIDICIAQVIGFVLCSCRGSLLLSD